MTLYDSSAISFVIKWNFFLHFAACRWGLFSSDMVIKAANFFFPPPLQLVYGCEIVSRARAQNTCKNLFLESNQNIWPDMLNVLLLTLPPFFSFHLPLLPNLFVLLFSFRYLLFMCCRINFYDYRYHYSSSRCGWGWNNSSFELWRTEQVMGIEGEHQRFESTWSFTSLDERAHGNSITIALRMSKHSKHVLFS